MAQPTHHRFTFGDYIRTEEDSAGELVRLESIRCQIPVSAIYSNPLAPS